ncbi:MAG: hypothetical protein Q8R69_10315 [Telluria sp.]|nr:hypothetical protein [Telluria sp.]
MLKPPTPNVPGAGAVADTLDFVKNLWGSMSVPGMSIPAMTVPTLSLDDLDKKIADLKAVEAWLNVNTAMLRGTIHALEVQRGTISTLKSMGAALANAVTQPGANEESVLAAAPFASAFFGQPGAAAAEPEPEKKAAPEAAPEAPPSGVPLMPNPGAWWNMLQDQFKQAVAGAMAPDALAKAGAPAPDAAAKPPASRAAAKPAAPKAGEPKAGGRKPKAGSS